MLIIMVSDAVIVKCGRDRRQIVWSHVVWNVISAAYRNERCKMTIFAEDFGKESNRIYSFISQFE